MSYVYFLRGNNVIKVGCSIRPAQRIRDHQIRLSGVFGNIEPIGYICGDYDDERRIHKHLKALGLECAPGLCQNPSIPSTDWFFVGGCADPLTAYLGSLELVPIPRDWKRRFYYRKPARETQPKENDE